MNRHMLLLLTGDLNTTLESLKLHGRMNSQGDGTEGNRGVSESIFFFFFFGQPNFPKCLQLAKKQSKAMAFTLFY